MRALSIRQPWAWLIVNGYKDIENRDWATNYRGRVYVHAGKKPDGANANETRHIVGGIMQDLRYMGLMEAHSTVWDVVHLRKNRYAQHYGAIVGEVTITDCVTDSDSDWFVGDYGFVLTDPKAYDKPIPCRGQLGLFEVEI